MENIDREYYVGMLAELRGALAEIDRIVRVPTRATTHRSAEIHFQADFDAIRRITTAFIVAK